MASSSALINVSWSKPIGSENVIVMVSPGPGPGLLPSLFATSDIMVGTFIENTETFAVNSSPNRCAKGSTAASSFIEYVKESSPLKSADGGVYTNDPGTGGLGESTVPPCVVTVSNGK